MGFLPFPQKQGNDVAESPGMRTPDAIRPLTLTNADSNILAGALNKGLSAVAPQCVHPNQNGFVDGRSIIGNIVHIEGAIQRHLLIEGNEPGMTASKPIPPWGMPGSALCFGKRVSRLTLPKRYWLCTKTSTLTY